MEVSGSESENGEKSADGRVHNRYRRRCYRCCCCRCFHLNTSLPSSCVCSSSPSASLDRLTVLHVACHLRCHPRFCFFVLLVSYPLLLLLPLYRDAHVCDLFLVDYAPLHRSHSDGDLSLSSYP
eukprot:m.61717 g.61717  ORF g.61717 m.61717 type:complete len:124 (+) comp13355_c0_seq1:2446-2817(+)